MPIGKREKYMDKRKTKIRTGKLILIKLKKTRC